MKVQHLNLTVTDVPAAQKFLETYFGLKCRGNRGDGFAVMNDEDDFILTLMKGREVSYPKTFHVGFPQENQEQVDKINQQMKEDGLDVNPPVHAHGYTFYVKAPGGFTVEVLCPSSKMN
ncbi:catechol 2,3-dioxygenase-like lactoylglutathione lyase family enzyme [Scopulibacillus darangshiensis]|uniref:Catechol 2,3-dioxygenase-like lactoylglutathione lyase family enzyme n=1 Tax=Scopulibacillus darangshiensis TaxID=442528 RepID=A0A4V2SKW8_9BACL|nr:VOC family protein [Scopulibacillus darangshiensis]TCP21156.1 catechol 2,3-dioxygenase-like lactoylglutathione lyase family enzyme [Scopulibacillus darangshiensis]